MRAYDQGSIIRVTVSASEVYDFGVRWPCFGPYRAFSFLFERRNGDLVGLFPNDEQNDGAGVVALSIDAQNYAAKRLDLPSLAR